MTQLLRDVSAHIQKALTGVGRASLISEIDSNRSIAIMATTFDRCVSSQDIQKRLNDKLLTFDRFKSKITKDSKYFEIIPNFDCIECMEETIISSSTFSKSDSLKEFISETLSSFANRPFIMKYNKPLWRMHLFQFKSLNITVMIFRFHHCICDGITFGEIWYRLSDNFEEERNINNNSSISSISTNTSSIDSKSSVNIIKCNDICYKLLYFPIWIILWIIGTIYVLCKMFIFAYKKEPETIFKNKLSEKKYIGYISEGLSFDKINKKRKSIRIGKRKVTFNDFMLTVIAESITLYLDKKVLYIPNNVHIGIPVNIRDKNIKINDTMLGNKIGSYIIKFPIGKKLTFMERLKKIKNSLDFAKKTPEAKLSYFGFVFMSILPKCLGDIIGPKMTNGLTLVASNVKGATMNIFMCKAKVIDTIGIVPPPMGVGLGYVIFTFNGKIIVTVNVDKNCYDEHTAKELMECMKEVLQKQGCVDSSC